MEWDSNWSILTPKPVLVVTVLHVPTDVLTCLFLLPQPAASSQRSRSAPGPPWTLCSGQVPNSCLSAKAGFQKGEEGVMRSLKKRSQFSTPRTAQLPGYCPRPGRHLLWVISICMAIITAFGKKIPLSQSPAELLMPAQNWRRQLRQTPRLLPIMQELPVPTAPLWAPKEHGRPC